MISRRVTSACLTGVALAWLPSPSPVMTPVQQPPATVSPASSAAPSATPGEASPNSVVLAPVLPGSQPPPSAAGLTRAVTPLLRSGNLGPSVGAAVVDGTTGAVLYAPHGGSPLTPASTTKLLTAAAVLATAGPDTRLVTRVVTATVQPDSRTPPAQPPPGPARIVLVGGGDPTLTALPATSRVLSGYPAEASLTGLAAQTAQALRRQGARQAALSYDAGLFTGRGAAASWRPGYVHRDVAPVSALSVDQGRVRRPGSARVRDPAAEAARVFAGLLQRHGIAVRGRVGPGRAPVQPVTLAAVASPPLSAIVEQMLERSDNDMAEALARRVALATGAPASFDGAARAMIAAVGRLGVSMQGVRLYDGSGLSRGNRIPAVTLAHLLRVAASPEQPVLRTVLTGLPVAGFTGTLDDRFVRGPAANGSGLVKGKTGTLTGVTSLAGVVPDRTGRLLAYAFLADRVPGPRTLDARDTMDRLAAVLAQCGCR